MPTRRAKQINPMSSPAPETDQTTRGLAAQLPRNLAANITYFLANVIIGILLVSYFVNTLGIDILREILDLVDLVASQPEAS